MPARSIFEPTLVSSVSNTVRFNTVRQALAGFMIVLLSTHAEMEMRLVYGLPK